MSEIIKWSAVETAAKIRSKSVSVTEVTEAHLARIDECEPNLRAVVEVRAEQALATARIMDAHWPEDDLPPMYGLPVTIKINVDMVGSPTSNGVPALNEKPASDDSPVVSNLQDAGAVIIGRTNAPEFSLRFSTSNPLYGVTKNPWNEEITPGGSSGGASAAVAAGIGVLGHGNDLGGSLRYPSYCCGLATLRPSLGRVPAFVPSAPAERPAALQLMSVQGVIARKMGDVKLAMGSLRNRSVLDPQWNPAANSGRGQKPPYKIGYVTDLFGEHLDAEVGNSVEIAVSALKSDGHDLVDVKPPLAIEAAETWGRLLNTDIKHTMQPVIEEAGSSEILKLVGGYRDFFGSLDGAGIVQSLAERLRILREWGRMFEDIDVLVMPVSGRIPMAQDQDFRDPDSLPDILRSLRFMYIINLLGLPSAVVPTGVNDGIPSGVQIVGPQLDDDLCMDVAGRLEAALGLSLTPLT